MSCTCVIHVHVHVLCHVHVSVQVYQKRYGALKRQQEEAERLHGADPSAGPVDRPSAEGLKGEAENEWRDRYFELVGQMREHELLAPYAKQRHERALSEPPRLLAEACALLEVVYEDAVQKTLGQSNPEYYTSFVWHLCGDLLLEVRRARLRFMAIASRCAGRDSGS